MAEATTQTLWLIPAFPLLGFMLLFATLGRLPKWAVSIIAAGSVGASAIITLIIGLDFYEQAAAPVSHTLWTWMDVGGFRVGLTLYLDGLALVMTGVITGVGFLIHLYATGYMSGEKDFSRFFAYMNLFVFAMLMLVLGDNLLLLFLGWEGVGLCSYLLIGFFHNDPANGLAARKAFVVTRVGDTAFAVGLFLLFRELGSLEIQKLLATAPAVWPDGSTINTAIALLLLGGAVGKSAQVPLQTWLPDAMAGPTPVSALIHAATMVTAGVYLIARMHDLFLLSETAQFSVAVVGLVTLLISSFAALTQTDLKRILAYSTMSQIGYMFLALGVGAWSAAIFHLMTHAFFKALLFLCAGSVIMAIHHEQNIYKMGGLWKKLPIPFIGMLVGSAALAALPFTSGFYSKDAILLTSFEHPDAGLLFWCVAALAAFITTLYTVRMMMLVFFGEQKSPAKNPSSLNMTLPLVALSLLAVGGGWFGLNAVSEVLPDGGLDNQHHEGVMVWITAAVPIVGVIVGYLLYGGSSRPFDELRNTTLGKFWTSGWGFDALYDAVVVKPFMAFAKANKNDVVDLFYQGVVAISRGLHGLTALTQTGHLRWYAANFAIGLIVVLVIVLGVR